MAHILTINDDADVRYLFRQILKHAGYEIAEAHDAREGIASYRAAPTDLLIIDLFMPVQKGLETSRQLRQEFPAVKIIAIPGSGPSGTLDFLHVAEKFGASRILRKPIDVQEFRDVVRELLESPKRAGCDFSVPALTTTSTEAHGMESPKGFFACLFDFSFTTLLTSKVIKLPYGLSVVGAGLGALGFMIGSFSNSVALGIAMLIIGVPLYFLLVVIYARVLLEIIMVIFQMAEHVAEIAAQDRRGSPYGGTSPRRHYP